MLPPCDAEVVSEAVQDRDRVHDEWAEEKFNNLKNGMIALAVVLVLILGIQTRGRTVADARAEELSAVEHRVECFEEAARIADLDLARSC
jgi:hypothetical protein